MAAPAPPPGALRELAELFGSLAFLAIGGVNAVLPEMQRQATLVHRWMSEAEFAGLFALAQAAPGPNFLVAALVGLRVAGLAGAATATACLIGPTCLLTYAVAGVWHGLRAAPWRRVVQAGLTSVTVGLVLSAAVLLAASTDTTPRRAAVTAAVTAACLATRFTPLWWLAAGAALGVVGVL